MPRTISLPRLCGVLALVAQALWFVGCAGRAPTTARTTTAARCLAFDADPAPPGASVRLLAGPDSRCDMLELELVVDGVRDLFAASFDVAYDPAVLRYAGLSVEGSFLDDDGTQLRTMDRDGPGRVVTGVTRWQQSTGLDATSPQLLAKIRFTAAAASGASTVELVSTSLLGSEAPPMPKPGIRWAGGTVRVVEADGRTER